MWLVGDRTNQRGATLAVVAVSMAAILMMGAVSVDLGMLLKMHNDAQRTADAAALAGASAYLEMDAFDRQHTAVDRALDYAARNGVGGAVIDTSGRTVVLSGDTLLVRTHEATVEAVAPTARVRVTILRPAIVTFFARLLGSAAATVSASAVAAAVDASAAGCVMPFAVPDMWQELTQANGHPTEDVDGDQVLDENEDWTFDPAVDSFVPFDPAAIGAGQQTGYGSAWRNNRGEVTYRNDYGRLVFLKPGNFRLWDFAANNGTSVADRIRDCDPRSVTLGAGAGQVVTPGDLASISAGVQDRIDRDRGRIWDGSTARLMGDWRSSPRVVRVALYDPRQAATLTPGQPIAFNNIALFFLENVDAQKVTGRFLYYASGGANGATTGPLVKTLRLVE